MARTKASVGAKVSMGKSSKARCSAAPPSSNSTSSGEKSSRSYSGGNPVHPRETPKWQKPITTFVFSKPKNIIEDSDSAGSSKSKPKRKIIYSDDESDCENKNDNKENEFVKNTNETETVEPSQVDCEGQGSSVEKENVDNKSEVVENQVYGGESQDYDLIESPPKNRELDESLILEPLTGESSHKLEEYFPKTEKKPKAGKVINKENLNNNLKRNLADAYEESPNKKIRFE